MSSAGARPRFAHLWQLPLLLLSLGLFGAAAYLFINPGPALSIIRSRVRPGMVTGTVVRAFASIGWKWGGAWTGTTKDYMHFSWNGH